MASETAPSPSLATLLQTDMNDPLDKLTIKNLLSHPPFLALPGLLNTRDLGLLPSSPIPPGLLYRSGTLSQSPPSTLQALHTQFSLNTILDLRISREVERSPFVEVEGVERVWCKESRAPEKVEMGRFLENGGMEGYVGMYEDVLRVQEGIFRRGFEWVRDWGKEVDGEREEKGKGTRGAMLFCCTAGKDRTGVLSALFLSLAGAPSSLITHDYALSRLGVEPARETLLQMLKLWNTEWTPDTPGMKEFVQVKEDFMLGFLEILQKKYGGAEGYVKSLGFGEEEVGRIKGVLRGKV